MKTAAAPRRIAPGLGAALTLTLLAGCTGGSGEAALEVGTGETHFEPLDDYQRVPLVAGPQGGHHVWLSLRAQGLAAGPALLDVDAVPLDATEPPPRREPVRAHLRPASDGEAVELVGWPAQLARPECLVDTPLSVRVTLTDERGRSATDERIVVPEGNPLLGECDR